MGTKKHPSIVRSSQERAGHLEFSNRHGIQVIVGIESDQQQDLADVEHILRDQLVKTPPRIAGDDYCPCGPGKKYEKCCAI
jgi:hypothetical protein